MRKVRLFVLVALAGLLHACSTTGNVKMILPSAQDTNLETQVDQLGRTISASLSQKKSARLAVIEFTDVDGNGSSLGRFIAEELTTRLFKVGSFQVIERNLIEKILREQQLGMTGVIDEKTAAKVGSLVGADFIATGTLADLGSSVKINARVVSVEKGSVFSVASVVIAESEQVRKLLGGGASGPAAARPDERLVLGNELFDAAENGQTDLVRDLLRRGAEVDVRGIAGKNTRYPTKEWTPLLIAAHKGYARIVALLLEKGADIHAQNYGTRTPLHLAAEKGHMEIVKMLIAKGADVNKACSHDQWTPLHMAAYYGQASAAFALLEAKADPFTKNIQGSTPLDYAREKGLTSLIKAMEAPPVKH